MKWITFLALFILSLPLAGQVTEEEHLSHHPDQAAEAGSNPDKKANPKKGGGMMGGGKGGMMGGGMGGMMKKMGVPPPKDTYPSLMDMPNLPLEKRAEFEKAAHARMQTGASAMTAAIVQLSAVASGSNFAEMQKATTQIREGLAQFESGLAAHRALSEGQPPRNVALQWFKKQMDLTEIQQGRADANGVMGLSWLHFFSMLLLIAFALLAVWAYLHKMRRASSLVEELSVQAKAAAPAPSPQVAAATATPQMAASAPVVAAPPPAKVSAPAAATPEPTTMVPTSSKWSGELRVALTLQETVDVTTIRMVDPKGGPIPFVFRPGQFATVEVEVDGKKLKRCYTIASSPTQRDYIEISVKCDPKGAVSQHLCNNLHVDDSIQVTAPAGTLTFDGSESESIVLIGGGVGITPLMSVLRYLTDRAWPGEIVLLYSCRSSSQFIFREELEFLQHRHANLRVLATMTRDPGTDWMGMQGHITRATIESSIPDIANKRIHVCGPPPMMNALSTIFDELKVPAKNVKTEAFGPASRPKPTGQASPPAKKEASTASPPVEAPPSTLQTFAVSFRKSGKDGKLAEDQTVLDLADDLGVEIESSCRMGSCGACKVQLVSGEVAMECDDGLDDDEKEAGTILACQAMAKSNLVIEE